MRLTTLLCVPCVLAIAGVVAAHYAQTDRADKDLRVHDAGSGWTRKAMNDASATTANPFSPNELTTSLLAPTPLTRVQRERAAGRWHQLHEQAQRAQLENEMKTPIRRSASSNQRRSAEKQSRGRKSSYETNKRKRRRQTMFQRTNRYSKSGLYDRNGRRRNSTRPANPRYNGRNTGAF